MNAEPYRAVGRIVKTHGLNGEVSVAVAAGASLHDLIGVAVWFVPPSSTVRTSSINGVRQGPKGPLVSLSGVSDAAVAGSLRGSEILVRTEDLPDGWGIEEEDDDLAGFTVTDVSHGLIGEIVETIVTGANDVWVVEGPFGEVLIPVIDDVVDDVDEEARAITVTLLDGLLPEDSDAT